MLRDLVTQTCSQKKPYMILDTPEQGHVDSENIKFKIGRRSSVYQLLKNVIFSS
jgi:hypothetical protein